MKKIKIALFAFFVMLFAVSPLVGASAGSAPDELVRELSGAVLDVLRTDQGVRSGDVERISTRVEAIVLPHFNFRRMTMLAVGRDWRDATPEQQQRLVDAFYGMLVRTYSNALGQYKNQTIAFKPVRMSPEDKTVRVQTEIRQPGAQSIAVDYVLERTAEGWKIFDVVVAGASLVTNYRGSFAQEIRVGGIDGLIRALETRQRDFEQSSGQR